MTVCSIIKTAIQLMFAARLCVNVCVLTDGLCSGGTWRWEVFCEVDIAHVAAAAAEVVRPVLDLWREVGHHAAIIAATLVVAQVSPAT